MADNIIKLTEEQTRFNTECRQLYNSGHMQEAYEMALEQYIGSKASPLMRRLWRNFLRTRKP